MAEQVSPVEALPPASREYGEIDSRSATPHWGMVVDQERCIGCWTYHRCCARAVGCRCSRIHRCPGFRGNADHEISYGWRLNHARWVGRGRQNRAAPTQRYRHDDERGA